MHCVRAQEKAQVFGFAQDDKVYWGKKKRAARELRVGAEML